MRAALLVLGLAAASGCSKRPSQCRALAAALSSRGEAGGSPSLQSLQLTDKQLSAFRDRYSNLLQRTDANRPDLDVARDLGRRNVAAAAIEIILGDEDALVKEINAYCSR